MHRQAISCYASVSIETYLRLFDRGKGRLMLSETHLLRYTNLDFRLSEGAKSYIRATRRGHPSRMVGAQAKSSVTSFVASEKMGFSLSAESRTGEKAFIILSEYDERVLELWDQPEPVFIERTDKKGRKRRGSYTPDFLILGKDGPEVVEVKSRSNVDELLSTKPDDWIKGDGGEICFLPAHRYFKSLGIGFRVFISSPEIQILVANLEILLWARRWQLDLSELARRVETAMNRQFAWSLSDLAQEVGEHSVGGLIKLIDRGDLVMDMRKDMLSQPEGCVVSSSFPLLQEARHLLDQERIFTCNSLTSHPVIRVPTEKHACHALRKLEQIDSGVNNRNVRRWRAEIRAGELKGLSPFQSLVPKYYRSGNRRPRLPSIVEEHLEEYLRTVHAKSPGLSNYRSYIRYRTEAESCHPSEFPVSSKTFNSRLRSIPADEIAFGRGGKRAGNASAAPTDPEERALKPQLPWQLVAIDHYLADIFIIFHSGDKKIYVERPWITAMVDLFSKRVLAITVSFLSPSRRAVSKVMRECVRRHRRLPHDIMVDRGAEFRSTYTASLTAHYKITYSLRPASHPRYGSEVERFFGEFKQQWLSQRPGNLADYDEARAVDGNLSPRKNAILKPSELLRELKLFCSWRENKLRGDEYSTSLAMFNERSLQFPFIGIPVQYNSEFMIMTAVDSRDFKLDQRRGIHLSSPDAWFYSPKLARLRGKRSKLEVRFDPENPCVVYAHVVDEWVPCYSSSINTFASKDPNIQLAEGLVKLEAGALRRRIRLADDQKLARLIRELDRSDDPAPVEQNCCEDVDVAPPIPHSDLPSILEDIALDELEELEAEDWEAPL